MIAVALMVAVPTSSAAPAPPRTGLYTGTLVASGEATVKIKIRKRNLNPVTARVFGVPLRCNEGVERIQSFRLRGEFRRDGTLRLQQYVVDHLGVTGPSYAEFSGRFKGASAHGTFFYISASTPDPGGGCSTYFPRRWRAEAQPRSGQVEPATD